MNHTLETLNWYLNNEYITTVKILENKPSWVHDEKWLIDATVMRCLGAAAYASVVDEETPFTAINELYEKTKEKLDLLLTNKK